MNVGVSRPDVVQDSAGADGLRLAALSASSKPCQSRPARAWQPLCAGREYDDCLMSQSSVPRAVGLIGT